MKSSVAILVSICLTVLGATVPAAAQNLLNEPESVVYDTLHGCYLVSNWNDGRIVRVETSGTQSYFNTDLASVAGLHIVGNTLYASSNFGPNAGLVGIDLETGAMISCLPLPGMIILNDITTDTSGYLYVSEFEADLLYRVHPATQTHTVLVSSGLRAPNGLLFDAPNNRLLLACNSGVGNDPIYAVSLPDGIVTTAVNTNRTAVDGLTEDENGNIYFSSWTSNAIYRYDHDFTIPSELFAGGFVSPADIFYNEARGEMAIPEFNANRLTLILNPDADSDGDGVLNATDNCPWAINSGQTDTDGDEVGDACDNCVETPNTNQADLNHSGIGDACEPGFTGPGAWVTMNLTDSIRILFGEVIEAGVTAVDFGTSGPAAPSGYRLVSAAGLPYFDIHTDATYAGQILVRFLYDPAWLTGAEEDLRLFHEVAGGEWEDCIYSQDVGAHVIWGEVTSLSNFILAEPGCPCDCHADPQCDAVTNVLDVVTAVNVAFRGAEAITDPGCANEQTDVSCDGVTNVIDVVKFVNVAFRSGDAAIEFCNSCAP